LPGFAFEKMTRRSSKAARQEIVEKRHQGRRL
jgi:hypothetical protein